MGEGRSLQRYALGVEYDGARYHGWQRQARPRMPTVQDDLEDALSRIADHPVIVHCAGRTDAGVHALCQTVHFDSDAPRPLKAWHLGTNTLLSAEICVRWVRPVPMDFHARHGATRRRYRYVIYNQPSRSAVLANKVTWKRPPLDAAAMHRDAQCLLGSHDFTSYRASACQSSTPIRDIFALDIQRQGALVLIDIEANAFLMHMVRNIAGVLMAVGSGQRPAGWTREVLEARDRRLGGVTAPPHGLYFVGARYPEAFDVPAWAGGPEFTCFQAS